MADDPTEPDVSETPDVDPTDVTEDPEVAASEHGDDGPGDGADGDVGGEATDDPSDGASDDGSVGSAGSSGSEADGTVSDDATAAAPDAGEVASTSAEAGTDTGGADQARPAVVRKKVTSKRVTPKGSPQGVKARSSSPTAKARASSDLSDDEVGFSNRYQPPQGTYAPGPSPWWVPALMFALLIIGALVIMLNYMGVFGDPENLRLVIGLAFILGGIITATQYR